MNTCVFVPAFEVGFIAYERTELGYSINVFTKVKELKCTNVHGKHIRKDQYGKKERGLVIDHVCLV
ncbi:hypothetical protein HanHA300_Chr15g0567621 [Helianthus annuus]|nr:hypothetical protein HanHA300_Chr15g0567621 [Helianthus annuus]KAJ0473323.1 hypothetical protein HanHA89_Chr15g0617001 [Helianthus annuus]KAJ0648905.1 hypothetical protein HanLR1_Chr15g0578131 [Helianthus annuus]